MIKKQLVNYLIWRFKVSLCGLWEVAFIVLNGEPWSEMAGASELRASMTFPFGAYSGIR